jgi:hypothetical protein
MVRTKEEINKLGTSEYIAKKILNDQRFKKMFAFSVGSLLYFSKTIISAAEPTVKGLDKINYAGNTLLTVARTIGYWVCLVMCIVEIIKSVANGDTKSISKIVMKYILAIGAFYMLPWLFDLVKAIFS